MVASICAQRFLWRLVVHCGAVRVKWVRSAPARRARRQATSTRSRRDGAREWDRMALGFVLHF
jgi:hypothetical protein